jgi:spore coat protein CotH
MNPRVLIRQIACVGALLMAVSSLPAAQAPQPPSVTPPPLPSDEFFNPDVVRRLDLRVNSLDWEKLKQFFQENTYYPADIVWEGQTVHNSGIRSRGLGSRSATKPGLRVDMDRYAIDQTFLGMKSFILDNLTQDHSGIHETVTMRLFARLGIPAPREAHVRLYVNNQYAGLYALVESIDKQFLARIFGTIGEDTQNDGFLYEFDYLDPWTFTYLGPTLEAYSARFDPKTHENATAQNKFGPLEEVVRLANDLPADQYMTTLNARLDLNAFIRYVAAQNFVGQNDGFLGNWGMNNFYFYRKENSTQHVFLAWDEDNAFWGPTFPIDMRHQENVLMQKCMQIPELRSLYYAVLAEAAASSQEPTGPELQPWLAHEVRRQSDLIQQAMQEDTKKPYSNEEHLAARQHMEHFANERSSFVLQQMASQGLRRR